MWPGSCVPEPDPCHVARAAVGPDPALQASRGGNADPAAPSSGSTPAMLASSSGATDPDMRGAVGRCDCRRLAPARVSHGQTGIVAVDTGAVGCCAASMHVDSGASTTRNRVPRGTRPNRDNARRSSAPPAISACDPGSKQTTAHSRTSCPIATFAHPPSPPSEHRLGQTQSAHPLVDMAQLRRIPTDAVLPAATTPLAPRCETSAHATAERPPPARWSCPRRWPHENIDAGIQRDAQHP